MRSASTFWKASSCGKKWEPHLAQLTNPEFCFCRCKNAVGVYWARIPSVLCWRWRSLIEDQSLRANSGWVSAQPVAFSHLPWTKDSLSLGFIKLFLFLWFLPKITIIKSHMAKPRSDTDWSAYSSSGWTPKRAEFPVFVSDRKWEHSEVRHRRSIFSHFWFVSNSGWLPSLLLFYPACFLSSFEFVCFLRCLPHQGQIAFWNFSLSPVKICRSSREAEASKSEIDGYRHLGNQPRATHGSKEIQGFGLLWLFYGGGG